MAASNPESYNMGLSAIRIKRPNGFLVGQTAAVGNFTAEINPTTVPTLFAASTYPSYMRTAGAEGSGTITLSGSRPLWIDAEVSGGTLTTTAAEATPTVGTLSNTNGTSLGSALTFTAAATVSNNYDFLVEATSATELSVSYTSDRNEQHFENFVVSTTATEIGDTGVSVAASSTPNFTVGDRAEISVDAPHGSKHSIAIPSFRAGSYYQIEVWSAAGGADDSTEKFTVHRAFLLGVNITKTAKEMPTIEIPFMVLSPLDNSEAITRDVWEPAAS